MSASARRRLACLSLMGLLCVSATAAQERHANASYDPALYAALDFRMVGPFRGGRVTALTGVPSDPPVLYFGGTGGGLWRSTTYGRRWENVSDGFFAVGAVGAVAVAPSDPAVLYVGTGSVDIRSNVSTGRGLYKSTDGAKTWTFAGLPEAGQIGAVVVHPQNPDRVFVAALGHAFGPNPERGVYRSVDGGDSWQRVLFVSDSTGAVDLVMDPTRPEVLYAAFWRAERKPWTIISGADGEGGIYKTTDGGDTWTRLGGGLPQGLIGKIGLALSPANPDRLYALVEAPEGQAGLYRSDDGGAHFVLVNTDQNLRNRPFYYMHLTADPKDSDVVYVNNEGFFKSTDGGRTFRRMRTPHGDNHALWIHPDDPRFLFQANDGGVNVSRDGGHTWSTQYNQPTAELYHVVVDNQFPYRLYGEQQDNSTISVPSLPPTGGTLDPKQHWYAVSGCETGPIAVHPLDPAIVYGGCKGRFSRYNHRTGQTQEYWVYPYFNYGHAAAEMPYRFQRTAPIEVSPHDPTVIYHGSQYVHRTTDEGRTWERISPDLTAHPSGTQGYSGGPITRDITGEEVYSALYQIRESPLEKGLLWAGSNDGLVHVSRDGGATWQNVTPPDLPPGGRVQTIEPSPHSPAKAYVAVYRYMLDDFAPYLYRTTDYGRTWTRLTDGHNGLPADHPTRVVREDPDRPGLLYAGTEFGLFVSFDDGARWQSLQQDLPATPVTDLRVHRQDLVVSTMGRSFWILDDVTPLHQIEAATGTYLYRPRDAYRMRWSPPRDPDGGAAPEMPPYGALLHYYLTTSTDPVTLEILDAAGQVVRAYTSDSTAHTPPYPAAGQEMRDYLTEGTTSPRLPVGPGLHRVAWDLRYTAPPALAEGSSGGRGPMAAPGTYQVRLTAGGQVQQQPLVLRLDPRVAADDVIEDDLREQLAFNLRLRDRLTELRLAVAEARAVRDQLRTAAAREGAAGERARALTTALDALEDALVQTRPGKVGAQLKPMLQRQLTYLAGMTDAADQRPGRDAYLRLQDIEQELAAHRATLDRLLTEDLPALNTVLKQAGAPPVKGRER